MNNLQVSTRTVVVAFVGLVGSAIVYTGSTGVLGDSPAERIAWYGLSSIAIFSAIVMLWAGTRFPRSAQRWQWTLLAVGMASWATAETLWTVIEIEMGLNPFPGLPDVFYLAAFVLMLIALVDVIRGYAGQVNIGKLAVTPVILGVVMTAIVWAYLFTDILAYEEYGTLEKLLSIAYPMLDVWFQIVPAMIILFIIAKLGMESYAWAWTVLAIGFVAVAAADIAWIYQVWQETYAIGHVVDILWMVGYTLLAVAASLAVDVYTTPAAD